jgi:hypothetical protein
MSNFHSNCKKKMTFIDWVEAFNWLEHRMWVRMEADGWDGWKSNKFVEYVANSAAEPTDLLNELLHYHGGAGPLCEI